MRARPEHYQAVLRLQSANFIANLSEEERKDGFLSAEFTLEQVAAMAEDLGTMLALAEDRLAGFVCAFRREFATGSPVIAKMIECYGDLKFEGKPLSFYHSYIYGPVCIARKYRRHGVLRGLYEAQKKDLAGKFEVGVAFVARANRHSLEAHVAGLGMSEIGDFECNGNIYTTLAFRMPGATSPIADPSSLP
jgi:hypothetical protein